MSQITNIAWTDHTLNPWIGCTKVSRGCANCYAKTMDDNRFSKTLGGATKAHPQSHWGRSAPRVRTKGFSTQAYRYNSAAADRAAADIRRPRIFLSLCDWLDDEIPLPWLADLLDVIYHTPYLDWQLLTKRPQNFYTRLVSLLALPRDPQSILSLDARERIDRWVYRATPPANIWLGVSVEDQLRAAERIPLLLKLPAYVRWLSVEPLLEWVDLGFHLTRQFSQPNPGLHWVVVGGESGPGRRDCRVGAIGDVALQCIQACVPVFVKQDCAAKSGQQGRIHEDFWAFKQFPEIPTT